MKYFLDTEFYEFVRKPFFGKSYHSIELISIGIICEDGREYYAINKELNLKRVWNAWQEKCHESAPHYPYKEYWLRENVLKGIHDDLCAKETTFAKTYFYSLFEPFRLKSMATLIRWHGKTEKQILAEIKQFICPYHHASSYAGIGSIDSGADAYIAANPPEFYGYFSDYDWVLFCAMFGRMLNLPAGYPKYCMDLKQMMKERGLNREWQETHCPKPENKHNAKADASWNKQLYYEIIKQPINV